MIRLPALIINIRSFHSNYKWYLQHTQQVGVKETVFNRVLRGVNSVYVLPSDMKISYYTSLLRIVFTILSGDVFLMLQVKLATSSIRKYRENFEYFQDTSKEVS